MICLLRRWRLQCLVLGSMLFAASCTPEESTPDASSHGGSSGASSSSSSGSSSGSQDAGSGSSGSSSSGASSSSGSSSSGATSSSGSSSSGASSSSGSSSGSKDAGSGSSGSGASSSSGSTVTCSGSANASPGDYNKTISVGGTSRSYLYHIPPGYTGKTPMPVVIDFHPLGGSGSSQKRAGWGSTSDSKGFIGVWPNGIGNSWNVGRCCSTAQTQKVDDVGFVKAIIKQLQTDACIDTKRVYASGCSNGGGMAFMLGCNAADVIAAVAPVDFDCVVDSTNQPSCSTCKPSRPIAEIQFRATGDLAVPFNGGTTPVSADCPPGGSCSTFDFPGANQNFTTWASIDQCTGSAQDLSSNSSCKSYATCGAGTQIALCTQQGGSHCGNYSSLHIVDTAWEFFQKQSLP